MGLEFPFLAHPLTNSLVCANIPLEIYSLEDIMQPIEIIAQIIGIFGMAANIWSYQQKKKNIVIVLQLCGAALFTANFFMLGAITGAILNMINVALSLVFLYKDKTHADHIAWAIGFAIAYIASYVMTFAVFGKEPSAKNLITEFFPVIGTLLTIVSYRMKDAKAIRRIGFIRSPAWLAYDVLVFSIGGILCEIFTLISIIVGTIRFDIKKQEK